MKDYTAIIYVSACEEENDIGQSLSDQIDICYSLAKREGIEVAAVFLDPAGYPDDPYRFGLINMAKYINDNLGEVGAVIVADTGKIVNNVGLFSAIETSLRVNGVTISVAKPNGEGMTEKGSSHARRNRTSEH